jgi:molybdate transport repressor ModE-like protein
MKASMRFDLIDLRLFLFVAEAASITHGAERAGMALASASERIREMEQSLGAPLLERHRRGVRATAAGSALAHHAQLVVQQLERMRGSCRSTRTVLGRAFDCSPTRPQPPSFFPRPWPRS